jgi:membrane-associated phospholipid phosphatase
MIRQARPALLHGVVALALMVPATSRSDETFVYDLRIDLPVIAVGGTGWIVSESLKSYVGPSTCRWCDRNADGSDGLNAFDAAARNALRVNDTSSADLASNILGLGIAPVLTISLDVVAAAVDHRVRSAGVDTLLIVQAAVMAADLNQTVKFAAARERPFLHFGGPHSSQPTDDYLSFFSGHTALTFSLAVAGGTIASMRRYRLAPLIWVTGLLIATTTGYLRIAADKHYMSDVLVGATVGSACGFMVPYVFHRKAPRAVPRPIISATAHSASLVLTWTD